MESLANSDPAGPDPAGPDSAGPDSAGADLTVLDLEDGVKHGETVYRTLHLRPLKAGDCIDAAEAAEKVRISLDGEPVVVASPTVATAERLRRNVKLLVAPDGKTLNGPVTLGTLRNLSERDYLALVRKSEALDQAYLERAEDGGRDRAPGGRSDGASAGSDPYGAGAE